LKTEKKLKFFDDELWEQVSFEGRTALRKYAVSNYGRVISYKFTFDTGKFLSLKAEKDKPSKINVVLDDERKLGIYVHHMVAEKFLPKSDVPDEKYIIHIDRNCQNGHVNNLAWVNYEQYRRHVAGKNYKEIEPLVFFSDEIFKEIKDIDADRKYAVSNFGRLVSYVDKIEMGSLLGLTFHPLGYKIWNFRVNGEPRYHLLHRLVAEYFCTKSSEEHNSVIHLDHDKSNNHASNLQWVTNREQKAHSALDENLRLPGRKPKAIDEVGIVNNPNSFR
jgi:HNH endonuclease/NUMOD4 motif